MTPTDAMRGALTAGATKPVGRARMERGQWEAGQLVDGQTTLDEHGRISPGGMRLSAWCRQEYPRSPQEQPRPDGHLMNRVLTAAMLLALLPASWFAAADDVPRTRTGKPNFSGYYDISNLTPFTRPSEFGEKQFLTMEEAQAIAARQANMVANGDRQLDPERGAPDKAADPGAYNLFWMDFGSRALPIDGKVRTSVIIDPPNGQMPAITEAGRLRRSTLPQWDYWGKPKDVAWWMETGDSPYDDPEFFTLGIRCIYLDVAALPMRSLPYNNVKTFVQTDDHLVISVEHVHAVRFVRIAGEGETRPEHPGDWYNAYGGDSIGWWEGDTLVVETTNMRDHPGELRKGMQIVERFTPVSDKGLVYRFTVTDPDYEAPYTGELMFPRTTDFQYEYACHEGNYSMGSMLRGARLMEQEWLKSNTGDGAEE